MLFTPKESQTEEEAMRKLVDDINRLEEDKNKVGRYVLAIFAFVFLAASVLLAVVITTN